MEKSRSLVQAVTYGASRLPVQAGGRAGAGEHTVGQLQGRGCKPLPTQHAQVLCERHAANAAAVHTR